MIGQTGIYMFGESRLQQTPSAEYFESALNDTMQFVEFINSKPCSVWNSAVI